MFVCSRVTLSLVLVLLLLLCYISFSIKSETKKDDLDIIDDNDIHEECSSCQATSSRDYSSSPSSSSQGQSQSQSQSQSQQQQQQKDNSQKNKNKNKNKKTSSNSNVGNGDKSGSGSGSGSGSSSSSPLNEQMPYSQFPELDKYPDDAYRSWDDIPMELKQYWLDHHGLGCGVTKISQGVFWMGSEDDEAYKEDGESPYRRIKISHDFYIDTCEVTNGQFLEFWHHSGGQTEAEKYGWSFVFDLLVSKEINSVIKNAVQNAPWWIPVPNSNFRYPYGPDRNFNNLLNHPVAHVGWTDAVKYCEYRGGRLPYEAEWEYACRGGLEKKKFPWGDSIYLNNNGSIQYMMNIFTGIPYSFDDGKDHFNATAPVGSFPPNGYGLYDCTGNVWEWVWDYFTSRPLIPKKGQRQKDPKGPKQGRDRTMKGGSYMCHKDTCRRYRCAGRSHAEPDSSTGNLGFRCVYDTLPKTITTTTTTTNSPSSSSTKTSKDEL